MKRGGTVHTGRIHGYVQRRYRDRQSWQNVTINTRNGSCRATTVIDLPLSRRTIMSEANWRELEETIGYIDHGLEIVNYTGSLFSDNAKMEIFRRTVDIPQEAG